MKPSLFSDEDLTLIAGPCVIEDRETTLRIADTLAEIIASRGIPFVFKASFDKANRTSIRSYRGPGLEEGLEILQEVREQTGLPILTDFHLPEQAARVARVADVLQIPAFLCRQTDMLIAAGETGKTVNIKKGQFVAPWDMRTAVDKVRSTGNEDVFLTERGSFFGYNRLVVDLRSISHMKEIGVPVVMDVTHSLQEPSAGQGASTGEARFIPNMARAAAAWGCDGLFLETHPDPEKALCDGFNSLPLQEFEGLLDQVLGVWRAARGS